METKNFPESKKRKLSMIIENGENEVKCEAAKFEDIKSENEKLKQIIEKQNATIIDLAMDNTELKKEKLNQSILLKEYESEISRLKPLADELVKKNLMLVKNEIKTKASIEKYETQNLCMNVDLVSMKIVGEQIRATLTRNYECKINHLESTIENLIKKNCNLNRNMENAKKLAKARINGLKSSVENENGVKKNLVSENNFAKKMKEFKQQKEIRRNSFAKKMKELKQQKEKRLLEELIKFEAEF